MALQKLLSRTISRMTFLLPDTYIPLRYYGGKIYLNLREYSPMVDKALGIYEPWKTDLFFNSVRKGMTLVDVGVNKGYFSLIFARLMEDSGNVLSFEPDPDNCFWFRQSIKANRYKCIKLYQHALSDKEGSVAFYRGKKSGWGSIIQSPYTTQNAINVKSRKLDNVLEDEEIDKVDFVKIDVEGAELSVLKGAKKTLQRHNIKLAIDVDLLRLEQKNQLLDFLESFGFRTFRIWKELIPVEKMDEHIREIYAMKP
jgi:FkbM family methyltransferase